MSKTLSFARFASLSCAVLLSQSIFASGTDLSTAESDTIIKEDIAAAQVMAEFCPAIVGSEAVIQSKIKNLATEYLADLSNKNVTFESLQNDAEYVEILKAARADTTQTSKDEQKEVCEELLNM